VAIIVLSFIGVAGSLAHLLDGGLRVGDIANFQQTSTSLYGSDFTPHWYEFRGSPVTRAAHMAPGLLWMVFAPLQFVESIRRKMPAVHRWVGRVVVAISLILIPTGLVFAALHPFVGAFEELAPICFYTTIYIVAVTKGVASARRKDFVRHREWMLRAFSIGMGIPSVRLWFVFFLHTTGMHSQRFFATAFWIAFAVNLLCAEVWINVTRRKPRSFVAVAESLAAVVPPRVDGVLVLEARR
jgi:uncharacterized membrane protein